MNNPCFNVLVYDFNSREFVSYNIMPYLINQYKETKKKPKTFEEFKEFVDKKSLYQFWSRCQYEIILTDWPNQQDEKKIDVYQQIKMNIDIITTILMNSVNNN